MCHVHSKRLIGQLLYARNYSGHIHEQNQQDPSFSGAVIVEWGDGKEIRNLTIE